MIAPDSAPARTMVLAAVSALAVALMLLAIGRTFTGTPAIRASAVSLAELLKRDPAIAARAQAEGPPPARWSDKLLAQTILWRVFSNELSDRLGTDTALEVRGHDAGTIVWVRLPPSGKWIHWQTQFKATGLRAGVLAISVVALIGGVWFARRLKHRSLQAAENAREAILAGVSHDMRTPISRARFALELYGDGAGPQLVEEVESNLHELEAAADRFVDYARSNYDEPFTPTSFDTLVQAAIDARTSSGTIEFDAGAPGCMSLQLRNARALIGNVLDNALKHGAPPIRARTRQRGTELVFSVKDSGAGIPPSHHAEVLQPFTRLPASAAPGSGLGLAIVARVARRHGGRVELRNLDDGFEVRVTLKDEATVSRT